MADETNQLRPEFDRLYEQWEQDIQHPDIQISSRPKEYIELDSYRDIVELGPDVLPLVLDKVEAGVFLMNQAALELAGLDEAEILDRERELSVDDRAAFTTADIPPFLSEQQKSELIVKHLRTS